MTATMSNEHRNFPRLYTILAELMTSQSVDDATLSRATGVPASTIARMRLNPDANPTASTLRPIAQYFGVSISQLLGDAPVWPGHEETSTTDHQLPLVSKAYILSPEKNKEEIRQIEHWITSNKSLGTGSFAHQVASNSYGLVLRQGSVVIVDPERTPQDGDFVMIAKEGRDKLTYKQIITDGDDIYLKSINPEIKNIKPLQQHHRILGVIVEIRFSLVN